MTGHAVLDHLRNRARSNAMTGVPQAMASIITSSNGSCEAPWPNLQIGRPLDPGEWHEPAKIDRELGTINVGDHNSEDH
jgi:hypothetical protein